MNVGRVLADSRSRAGSTQAVVAARAGTSQATVAAYEAGRKSPRLDTLERLATALGCRLAVELRPPAAQEVCERHPSEMSREEQRSLWLHRAIAVRVQEDPVTALALARQNLAVVRVADPLGHSESWTKEWEALLAGPIDSVLVVLTSTSERASQLRQTAPFAALLTSRERWALYRTFESSREARTA